MATNPEKKKVYLAKKKTRTKSVKLASPVEKPVTDLNGVDEDRPVKEPKNWPKVLKRVPMNRDVRIKELPPRPVFTSEIEKQHFLDKLREVTANPDWRKETRDAIDSGTLHIEFSGNGNGEQVYDYHDPQARRLNVEEVNRCAEATNRKVMNVNKEFTIPGQVTDDPKFILPVPTKEASGVKVDENDIPEYVLSAFIHPMQGFMLESTIDVGCTVRVVYRRDPEFFEAEIRIGEFRRMGEQMEIRSMVTKDWAKYAVTGIFTADSMNGGKQPRAAKLYQYLREKLGLN